MKYHPERLHQRLKTGTVLVTATQRLCNHIHDLYAAEQLKQQQVAWPKPQVYTLDTWLEHQLLAMDAPPLLLNPHQECYLWYQITEHRQHAQWAMQAFQALHEFHVDVTDIHHYPQTAQTTAFLGWYTTFMAHCRQHDRITLCQLPSYLMQAFIQKKIKAPQSILFIGFDALTPSTTQLMHQLNPQNQQQCHQCRDTHAKKPIIHHLPQPNETQEIEAMAQWAHGHLLNNPQSRLACIVPDLSTHRLMLDYHFTRVLAPDTLFTAAHNQKPFHISATQSLSQFPMIDTALCLLDPSWINTGDFLYHPFVDCEKIPCHTTPITHTKTLRQWAHFFAVTLEHMGWPGMLDPAGLSLLAAWQKLLDQLVGLSCLEQQVGHLTAYQQLRYLAEHTIFQTKETPKPVEILGALEATGLYFDALWLMGCDTHSWPPAATPNPFLPIGLQKQYRMPNSSTHQKHLFYQCITERLFQSARQCIVSHAKEKDDMHQQPSTLLQDALTTESGFIDNRYVSPESRIAQSHQLECLSDDHGPEYPSAGVPKGGTQILKHQAACPFRAFAQCRLQAQPDPKPRLGLSPQDKGSIIHQALAQIWDQIKDQKTLRLMTPRALTDCVQQAVDTAIKPYESDQLIQHILLAKSQFNDSILAWLEQEKDRTPFTVIATEQPVTITLSGISFSLRMDRIDQLHDHTQFLIDYKTCNTSIQGCFPDALDDPQLPLYAMAQAQHATVVGIAYAQVQPLDPRFKGLCAHEEIMPHMHVVSDWQTITHQWHQELSRLAQDFQQGKAQVAPKYGKHTCQYCHLQALCRIHTRP